MVRLRDRTAFPACRKPSGEARAADALGPRRGMRSWLRALVLTVVTISLLVPRLPGQEPPESKPSDNPIEQLADRQRQVAKDYEKLEQVLLRMSELSAASDPSRAALVMKAVAESKERLIGVQFASLVDQLSKDELAKVLEGQEKLVGDLGELLELLLSENRSKRLESEKARIREYLQQLNRIINQQKSLQARTTGGAGQPRELSEQQGELGRQTGGLAGEIRQNEERDGHSANDQERPEQASGKGEPKEPSQQSAEPSQEGSKPGKGSEAKSEAGDPADGSKPPGESPSGTPSEDQSSQSPSEGTPSEGAMGDAPPQSQEQAHSARERLESARRRMQQAQERLEKAEREGAGQEQEEAIRQLQQAKAELERILRQLREEEIEQVLVALEARLTKMLQMQREVYEGTSRLDKASAEGVTHEQEIEAGRLSSREAEIVAEADKALMLLREDGSAVAMPEALAQARDDMDQVVTRLARANVGQVTLGIEEDIVTALEEMLDAVRQAMKDAEERRRDAQQGEPGMPQDPALVGLLDELRMIRALQMRVNTRTQRYGEMITGQHAETPELMEALVRLAERQERVYRITSDLEAGKNR